METSITWISKHTARLRSLRLPLLVRLYFLIIAGVSMGIFSMVFLPQAAFAQTPTLPPLTYTPIPKANLILASTQGAPIEEHPSPTPSYTYVPSLPASSNATLDAELIFQKINSIRQQNGLPAFQQDSRLCALATSRAPEIPNEIVTGTMHQGMYARNLPYWNTENIIDINTVDAAVNWWMNDYIHRVSILGNYAYSCVACSGTACAEEFSNFEPK